MPAVRCAISPNGVEVTFTRCRLGSRRESKGAGRKGTRGDVCGLQLGSSKTRKVTRASWGLTVS